MDASRLAPFGLFASLTDAQRASVAAVTEEQAVTAGTLLTRTGEFGYHLYLIEEGEAEVLRGGEVIATLGPGSHFGEIALLITGQRTADVRARTPMRLLVIFDRALRDLDRDTPELGRTLRSASAPRMPGATPA